MNRSELVKELSHRTRFRQGDCESMLKAFEEILQDRVGGGEKIVLYGFGTFYLKESAPKLGRDPRDPSRTFQIPARKKITFKPAVQS